MPLPKPIGRQVDVLYLPAEGHQVVLGTAGSGKTTIALLRSAYLASAAPEKGRTLLITFNALLAKYLEFHNGGGVPGLDIRHYHHFARGYLASRGLMRYNSIIQGGRKDAAIEAAVAAVRTQNPAARILQQPFQAISEEIAWIGKMGIADAQAYADVERTRRGAFRVAGADRALIWAVYTQYLAERTKGRFSYDWDDIAGAVVNELANDDSPRLYRHVVIDEGQDFSPMMLRSLAAAIPPNGSLTFFGDMAQQVYGGRISWRDAGLNVPRGGIIRFEENYRNTKQIAELALGLSRGPYFVGLADMVAPRTPPAAGVLPALVECHDEKDEINFTVEQAAAMAPNRVVGILLRDHSRDDTYLTRLRKLKIPVRRLHRDLQRWRPEPGVWVGTYYSGKGLEFDAVFLPHLADDVMPDPNRRAAFGDDDAWLAEEARLLYVAITRARATLIMSYHGKRTRLLDGVDTALYQELD